MIIGRVIASFDVPTNDLWLNSNIVLILIIHTYYFIWHLHNYFGDAISLSSGVSHSQGRYYTSKTVTSDHVRKLFSLSAVNYPHFLRLIVRKLLYLLKIHWICIYTRHRTGPILLGIESR